MNNKENKLKLIKRLKLFNSIDDKRDMRIGFFIIAFYFSSILNLTIKNVFSIPHNLYPVISSLFALILVILFIATFPLVLRRSIVQFFLIECLWISIYTISYAMGNADISLLFKNALWTICVCTPIGVYIYSIKNKYIFYTMFLISSFPMTIILSQIFIFSSDNAAYSMPFSYMLVVPTLFHINEWFKNYKVSYLLLFLYEISIILLFGSRGALVCIVFFFIVKFMFDIKSIVSKIIIIIFSLITFIGGYYYFDSIGTMLLRYLAGKGYYSRTLTMIFTNKINYDSGRYEIFSYYLDLIVQKPIAGWGVLGGWIKEGMGPHNMLIEIILAFGIIAGCIICMFLVLLQFRVIFVKEKSTRDLIGIYMSICIVLFFIAGNYLQNYNFFIFLALCLGTFKNRYSEK